MDKKILLLLGAIFLVVGTGLLLGAGYSYRSSAEFDAEAVAAEGTVIDLASHLQGGSTLYRPVVEFTDRQGRTIRISGSTGSSSPEYRRGDRVPLKYPPQAPEEARIESWSERWFGIALLGGMGLVFAGAGAGLTLAALRQGAARRARGRSQASPGGYERPPSKASGMEGWRVVEARVVSIDRSEGSGRHRGWRIVAQWRDPGTRRVHVFESEELSYDPTEYLEGHRIPVRFDPEDPESYEVDLAALPEAG